MHLKGHAKCGGVDRQTARWEGDPCPPADCSTTNVDCGALVPFSATYSDSSFARRAARTQSPRCLDLLAVNGGRPGARLEARSLSLVPCPASVYKYPDLLPSISIRRASLAERGGLPFSAAVDRNAGGGDSGWVAVFEGFRGHGHEGSVRGGIWYCSSPQLCTRRRSWHVECSFLLAAHHTAPPHARREACGSGNVGE